MTDFSKMNQPERIKYRRHKIKLSPAYIARMVGVTRPGYLLWEKQQVEIPWVKLEKLAEVLLTTSHWIIYGRENERYISNDKDGELSKDLSGVHIIKTPSIPIVGFAEEPVDINNLEGQGYYIDIPAKSGNVIGLQVNANHENSQAEIGDALICEITNELVGGDEIYLSIGAKGTIATFHHMEGEQLWYSSHDGKGFVQKDECTWFRVVGYAKKCVIKNRS